MIPSPSQSDRAIELLQSRPLLRLKDLAAAGIAGETVARLVRNGRIVRATRGLYQLAEFDADARHTLAEAAVLVPRGVVCLISALQFHELTLQTPSAVWMAIDRTAWKPTIEYPLIRFVRFGGRLLTEGIERHRIEAVDVPVFNPVKTVIDCFRYRNKIGLDVALEGLREGLRGRRFTPAQLWTSAREAQAWTAMRPYVEAMAADRV